MNTKTILCWAVAVVVAVGAWWFLAKGPGISLSPVENQKQHVLEGTPTPSGDLEYKEEEEFYEIHAVYPAKTSITNAKADQRARMTIEQGLRASIEQFKTDSNLEHLTPEDIEIQGLGGERKYTLDITYEAHASDNFFSYIFTIYSDTLGAHPNVFFKTFVFNGVGEEVALSDLFKENFHYLERLSGEAYQQIIAQLRERIGIEITPDMEETVRIGTSPTPETLQFFYLDGGALHIIIPPYQAAAYAAGYFDISVPLSSLKDILK